MYSGIYFIFSKDDEILEVSALCLFFWGGKCFYWWNIATPEATLDSETINSFQTTALLYILALFTLLCMSNIHNLWQRWMYPLLFVLSTDCLVKTWKEVDLELRPHSSAECDFCQQPLHFELMSEREKSYFTGLSHMMPAVAWYHI